MWVAHAGLIDDAYITLGYVQNLASDLHWGLIHTETSNTATSPLNIVLLTLATWLTASVTGELRPVTGLVVQTVVLSTAMAVWAARTARGLGISSMWSLPVLTLVFANPFVNSSVGLEVVLTAALVTGLTAEAVRGRRVAFGVLAGLLVLTRLDLGVVVAAVYLLSPALRRRPWVSPVVGLAVALPWFVFSWSNLGSAIPTSFVIKTLQRSFGDATFTNAWWLSWTGNHTLVISLAVVPALLGLVVTAAVLVAGVRRRLPEHLWPLAGLGIGGLAHFGAYCLLQVPSYHWYYVPTTVALGLVAVLGSGVLLRHLRGERRSRLLGTVVPVGTAVLLAGLLLLTLSITERDLPWTRPVAFGNWALPSEYLTIGADVGELVGDATVAAPPEIGTLAYACDCSMVDAFSDPGRTLPLVEERLAQAGPVTHWLLKANFARLDREQRPRPVDFRLVWTPGVAEVPPGLPFWRTSAPNHGPGTVWLEPVS